jgi:glycosyltransferase involved in cell wall biosynthesis
VKRLLFTVNVDWFFLSHRLPIAIEAVKREYEVHIGTTLTDKKSSLESNGIIVHPLNLHRSRGGNGTIIYEFVEIFSIIRMVAPDIVHLVTIKPVLLRGIASKLTGVPAVVSAVSGLGFVFVKKWLVAILRKVAISLLYHLAFGHSNQRIIFQNIDDQSQLIQLTKISPNKTHLIHGSGVELSHYIQKSIPDGLPVVMLAARLLVDKGVREFVTAAEQINCSTLRARFVLVGDIDLLNPASIQQNEFDQWKQDGVVELWGYSTDMGKVISQSTIVVLPSFYGEGLPKILIEAAACGRAVITTVHPGCRDVIEENVTGLLVPVRDVEALANAIFILLDDSVRCTEMGRAGRRRAEEMFDVRQVVAEHMWIYEELLDCASA